MIFEVIGPPPMSTLRKVGYLLSLSSTEIFNSLVLLAFSMEAEKTRPTGW